MSNHSGDVETNTSTVAPTIDEASEVTASAITTWFSAASICERGGDSVAITAAYAATATACSDAADAWYNVSLCGDGRSTLACAAVASAAAASAVTASAAANAVSAATAASNIATATHPTASTIDDISAAKASAIAAWVAATPTCGRGGRDVAIPAAWAATATAWAAAAHAWAAAPVCEGRNNNITIAVAAAAYASATAATAGSVTVAAP